MQRISFVLGVALLVVAATLAMAITLRKPPEGEALASENSSRYQSRSRPGRSANQAFASHSSSPKKSQNGRASHGTITESFSVSVPANHPGQPLLVQRSREVEAEANSQLEEFTKRLELTGEQRRRLFPILARSSEKYDPAMKISGQTPGASPLIGSAGNQEFNDVLDPPQRDQLVEDAITDQLLWQDIIGKLRQRLDEQTPQVPDAGSEVPEPTPQAPRGRGNLFEALDPQQ